MAKKLGADIFRVHLIDIMAEAADPSAGGGVAAAIGSIYSRDGGVAGAFLKTGAADTAWSEMTSSFNWYNVRDYGAVGDGVTDDRVAIAAAITACNAAGGGCVYFPRGTYAVSKDGANPYSFNIAAMTAITFLGGGDNTTIRQTGSAGTNPWSIFFVGDGSSKIQFELITFSGAGLTNPAASRANHLVAVGDGTGGVDVVRFFQCKFGDMVAASGDGIHVLGATGNLVQRLWVYDCAFDGCSRYSVGIEQGVQHVWIVDTFMTDCETEIAIISTGAGIVDGVIINGCEIVHTLTTSPYCVRLVGHDTDLITRLSMQDNVLLDGYLELANTRYSSIAGNTQTSGVHASTEPATRIYRRVSDTTYANNVVVRSAGAGNGRAFELEGADGIAPARVRVGGNVLYNEVAGQGVALLADLGDCSFGSNILRSANAGASVAWAIEVQAVAIAVDAVLVEGNQVTAAAGSWTGAIRYLVNGANMANPTFVNNEADDCDYGIRWEDAGVGAFSGRFTAASNTINAATGDYEQVGVTAVVYIGGNTAATGCQVITGNGDPEGAVTAPVGSLFMRRDGTTNNAFYYKETGVGATGWRAAVAGQILVFGAGSTNTTTGPLFFAPGYITAISATEIQMTATRPGTVRNLRVRVATAGTGAANVTVTVRKNGADQTLTTTFSNTANGDFSDLVNSFTVVAADEVSVQLTRDGAVAAGQAEMIVSMELL